MNQDQLFQFYEKLYFQELDRREKLSARLNLPLAILVAVIGFLSFMLNNAPRDIQAPGHLIFWIGFIASCTATGFGAWYFKASWFGHTDKLLPTANATEDYRNTLVELYKEYDEKDALVETALKAYLYDYYMKFSSVNTTNNDARAYHLYQATYAITISVLLAFFAFIPYFISNHGELLNGQATASTTSCSSTSPTTKR